jgi:tryptophan-rich hypothetical protein
VQPVRREKHFLVVEVVEPVPGTGPIVEVVLEAVLSRRRHTLPWRALTDRSVWRQGWVR